MYPADDIPALLGLTTLRTRSLQKSIDGQLARIRALYERAWPAPCRDAHERTAELIREVHETVRTSQELVEIAREHERRSRLLVQRSRERRLLRTGGEPA